MVALALVRFALRSLLKFVKSAFRIVVLSACGLAGIVAWNAPWKLSTVGGWLPFAQGPAIRLKLDNLRELLRLTMAAAAGSSSHLRPAQMEQLVPLLTAAAAVVAVRLSPCSFFLDCKRRHRPASAGAQATVFLLLRKIMNRRVIKTEEQLTRAMTAAGVPLVSLVVGIDCTACARAPAETWCFCVG